MDWDTEPNMAAPATNEADDWDTGDAAAVPLPASNDDFDFGAPSEKINSVVTAVQVSTADADDDWDMGGVAQAPAAATATANDDDDWDMGGGAPAAIAMTLTADADAFGSGGGDVDAFGAAVPAAQDDPFGGGYANADPFGAPAAEDNSISITATPIVKQKRVIRADLIPEKSKSFADFFVAELSEYYEDPKPDTREAPLRRSETHNIYSRELALSAAAGAEKPQQDSEKRTKRKSAFHYNGNRVTTNHTWSDFEVRLLIGMINRDVYLVSKMEDLEKPEKRRQVMDKRRTLNNSLPPAKDGHRHVGLWAYHDVADLLNERLEHSIPVVDVRDMLHRLVDERKGAQIVANRILGKRLTRGVVMAWRRKQDFVGDLKEWGDEKNPGRKALLQKQAAIEADIQNNTGAVGGVTATATAVTGVAVGWTEDVADVDEDVAIEEAFVAVVNDPFGAAAPAPAPIEVAGDGDGDGGWGDDDAPAAVTTAAVLTNDDGNAEWGDEELAVANDLFAATQAMPALASAAAPAPEPRGEFDLDDPFAEPLPGSTTLPSLAPPASSSWDDAPAAPGVDNGLDEWGTGDDSAAAVAQTSNTNTFMANAPSTIPSGNAPASRNTAMSHTTDSGHSHPALSHHSTGFTALNHPTHASSNTGFGNAAPPTSAPAQAQSYAIDPATGFNPERLALLAARDTRKTTPPAEKERDPNGSWGQNLQRSGMPGDKAVSGFNAVPLAFNRLTGQRADPAAAAPAPTSTPMGYASGNAGGSPLPGWGNSPKGGGAESFEDWDAPPAKAGTSTVLDKESGEEGQIVDADEAAKEKAAKEKQYVDLDAAWDDLELEY